MRIKELGMEGSPQAPRCSVAPPAVAEKRAQRCSTLEPPRLQNLIQFHFQRHLVEAPVPFRVRFFFFVFMAWHFVMLRETQCTQMLSMAPDEKE